MARKANLHNLTFFGDAEEFVKTYDFPKDLLIAVVQSPESERTLDPSTEEKGYPVIRFRRGDITVVVGFRTPENPMIIFVYLHHPEDHVQTKGTKKGGSGGSKMPSSTKALKQWLHQQGCGPMPFNGRGHYNIYYKGTLLGGIAATGNSDSVKNDFSFMRKRLMAEKAKEMLTEYGKKEKSSGDPDNT